MSSPSPQTELPQGPKPPRLAFLTVPLLAALFINAIDLLLLPFRGVQTIQTSYELANQILPQKLPLPSDSEMQTILWMMFFFTALVILWLYFTRRAVLEGKSWGRVSAIVIAVLSLLIFPFGTLMGIAMLIGAFDRDVKNYVNQ